MNSIKNSLKPYSIIGAEKIAGLVVKHTTYTNDVKRDDCYLETNPAPSGIRIKEYKHKISTNRKSIPPMLSKSPSRQTIASEESGFLDQTIKQKTKGFKTLRRKKTKIDEDIEMGEPIPPSPGPDYPYEETRAG